jgi:DNA-binding NtrC family response regulator
MFFTSRATASGLREGGVLAAVALAEGGARAAADYAVVGAAAAGEHRGNGVAHPVAERQGASEAETPVDLILLDVMLGDEDGRNICRTIKEDEKMKFIPVIILTVRSSLQDKINALNLGADDYLTKPFINEELLAKVRVMLRIKDLHDKLKREKDKNILLTQALEKRYSFANILGKNTRMLEIFELISDIANTDSTVLIQGESGTGKELIARAIHFHSHRKNKPFVVANCSAYSQNLLESELFGHEKGAFTGADKQRIGRLNRQILVPSFLMRYRTKQI